jgi:hypothetical protein
MYRMKVEREGIVGRSYVAFLELPVPVVLVFLWLLGAMLLGLCAAALYSYGLLLQAEA